MFGGRTRRIGRDWCINFAQSIPEFRHFSDMFPHAFLFVIASVLELNKEIGLVHASLVGVNRDNFLPYRCSIGLPFYLKECGFINGAIYYLLYRR